MRIVAIVQARMSSMRFPGKVLHPVAGRPMLRFLLERLEHCEGLDGMAVATSTDAGDDAIEAFCSAEGVACHRGELANVAARFHAAIESIPCDAFARVNGDSPLMDPRLVDTALDMFRQGGSDLVCNAHPRSFPKGQGVEVVSAPAFRRAFHRMSGPEELEHVTLHFYRNADSYQIRNFHSGADLSCEQMSVDTPGEMAVFESTIAAMSRPQWTYGFRDILDLRAGLSGSGKGRRA